jgi:hypothetical protein
VDNSGSALTGWEASIQFSMLGRRLSAALRCNRCLPARAGVQGARAPGAGGGSPGLHERSEASRGHPTGRRSATLAPRRGRSPKGPCLSPARAASPRRWKASVHGISIACLGGWTCSSRSPKTMQMTTFGPCEKQRNGTADSSVFPERPSGGQCFPWPHGSQRSKTAVTARRKPIHGSKTFPSIPPVV